MEHIAFGDLLVGLGFLLVVEGILFAAIPGWMRSAMNSVVATPDQILRGVGIISAILGLIVIWLVRV